MPFRTDLTARTLALTLGLAAAWPAWAAPGFVDLPATEAPAEWSALLARHGLREGEGGVRVEGGARTWRLTVEAVSGRRLAVVAAPRTLAQREAVAALAASLLSPGPSIAPPAVRVVPVALPPEARPRASAPPPPRAPPAPVAPSPPAPVAPSPPAPVAPSPPAPVAPSPPAPVAPRPPPPRPTPRLAVPRPPGPPPELHASIGLAGEVLLHPGLEATFGGGGDGRIDIGPAFVSVGAGATTPAPVGEGVGSLAVAHVGVDVGVVVADLGAIELRVGLGGGGLLWSVSDLGGERQVWSGTAEAIVLAERRLGPNASLNGGSSVGYDFQKIEVVGGSESPSPLMVRLFFGIRVGG